MSPKTSKSNKRHEQILSMLNQQDMVTVSTFCDTFGCSESTIRNDLNYLEEAGLLLRVLGGAKKAETTPIIAKSKRESAFLTSKQQIAEFTIQQMIPPNTTIILDAGTTTREIAKALVQRAIPVTVLTSSLDIVTILSTSDNIRLYAFGGFYDSERCAFYDISIEQYTKNMHADLFFMGINGVSPRAGFTIASKDEMTTKKAFMNIATRTIAVADHSKLGHNGLLGISDFERVKTLVTDAQASADHVLELRESGLDVMIAAESPEDI